MVKVSEPVRDEAEVGGRDLNEKTSNKDTTLKGIEVGGDPSNNRIKAYFSQEGVGGGTGPGLEVGAVKIPDPLPEWQQPPYVSGYPPTGSRFPVRGLPFLQNPSRGTEGPTRFFPLFSSSNPFSFTRPDST